MTNAKEDRGFREDEKGEEHCSTFNTSFNILEQRNTK